MIFYRPILHRPILQRGALAFGLVFVFCAVATAQWGPAGNMGRPPAHLKPQRDIFPGNKFTFCTVAYTSVRGEQLGFGWNTDYPDSGFNFMIRLEELTTIEISKKPNGDPNQVVVELTDEELFDYPYIFMSDVGTAEFSDAEVEALRSYLLRGGFLHVDDFWGQRAWNYWEMEIEKVLPPKEGYHWRDLPLTHEMFHIVFSVKEVPQVPSIQYWRGSRDGTTSERGLSTAEAHLRYIAEPDTGRIMVLMSHNTDIADGWEKEREDEAYFREFSVKKSYPIGINIIAYVMTH